MNNIATAEELVFRFSLDERSRERSKVWRRFYLCNFLRENTEMTLQEIADIVGLSKHDEVHYALRRHSELTGSADYKRRTKLVVTALKYGIDCIGQTLAGEVFKANTSSDLQVIKNKLADGVL